MVLNQPIQARHWSTHAARSAHDVPRASNRSGYFLRESRGVYGQAMAAQAKKRRVASTRRRLATRRGLTPPWSTQDSLGATPEGDPRRRSPTSGRKLMQYGKFTSTGSPSFSVQKNLLLGATVPLGQHCESLLNRVRSRPRHWHQRLGAGRAHMLACGYVYTGPGARRCTRPIHASPTTLTQSPSAAAERAATTG